MGCSSSKNENDDTKSDDGKTSDQSFSSFDIDDEYTTRAIISIYDRPCGWAEKVKGGGNNITDAIVVDTTDSLEDAVRGNHQKIILLETGTYNTILNPGSNTTIIGLRTGVTIIGGIKFSGEDKKNLIVRNLAIRGKKCHSYNECKQGSDAFSIKDGANLVWLDHLDIADGQDGNLDFTKGADLLTCTWCKFHYTYDKEHSLSNLIAGSDKETSSRGKLRVTYQFCMWGDRVKSRQPRGRFGKVHMINNYHNNNGNIYGVGREMSIIAEGCYYDVPNKPVFFTMGGQHDGWIGAGNKGTAIKLNDKKGNQFHIPYDYDVFSAKHAKKLILMKKGGAGNTCRLEIK